MDFYSMRGLKGITDRYVKGPGANRTSLDLLPGGYYDLYTETAEEGVANPWYANIRVGAYFNRPSFIPTVSSYGLYDTNRNWAASLEGVNVPVETPFCAIKAPTNNQNEEHVLLTADGVQFVKEQLSIANSATPNCQAPPVTQVCDFVSPLTVGNWNGLPAQIRKYPNGKVVLVTLEQGSSTDRHFPRGDNFWDIDGFVKTLPNAEQYRSCLNGGQTDWYGLVFPSGMTPPLGYVQGNMPDGAVYFEQSGGGTNPCSYTLTANNQSVSCGAQVGVSSLVSCTGGDCSGLSYSYNGSSTITASSSPCLLYTSPSPRD